MSLKSSESNLARYCRTLPLTPVVFTYQTEKSYVLIDSLYPDCWKPMMENETRERARTCGLRLVFELCSTKEQKLLATLQADVPNLMTFKASEPPSS
jgi:hypothetical protein